MDPINWLQKIYQLNNWLQQHQIIAINWNTKVTKTFIIKSFRTALLFSSKHEYIQQIA